METETERLVDLLEEIDKGALRLVRGVFEEATGRGEELVPAGMVFAMKAREDGTPQEKPELILLELTDYFDGADAGKDAAVRVLRTVADQLDGVAIYIVAEAWMVKLAVPEPSMKAARKVIAEGVRPSQHPNRIEMVNVSVSTKLGCHSHMAEITGTGTERKLGEWIRMEGGEGRLANLFNVPGAGGARA